jgi:dimethylhistidine N-methyltransferase
MRANGAAIARKVGTGGTVIELGAGSCEKARDLCQLVRPSTFVAIDISQDFLHDAVAGLRQTFPAIDIRAVAADLTAEIPVPADLGREQRLIFYPGSSIGNFDPPHALDLLSRVRAVLADDGALLIGVDLLKDVAVLEAAYDDSAGVTAAFNLNVLGHVNRLIGSDFDDRQWRHRAFFNVGESRIEMHLEAASDCLVSWPGGGRRFVRGECIHTENSYKYRREAFIELLARAGFQRTDVWTDTSDWFAVILARP